MKYAKTALILFTCTAISYTLIAKNKEIAKEKPIHIMEEELEEEEFLTATSVEEQVEEPPTILSEDKNFYSLAKTMYYFEKNKDQRDLPAEPSKEVKDACKSLDEAQYPNRNKKVLDKIQGIKSWIRIFSFKKKI